MDGINLLDLLLSVVFLYFIIQGFKKGLIKQTSTILGLIVALLIAVRQYQAFQEFLHPYLDVSPPVLQFLSFALLFIGCNLVIHMLGVVLKNIIDVLFLKPVDHIAGAVIGFVKGAVLAYLTVLILTKIPYDGVMELLEGSILANSLLELTPVIRDNLKYIFEHN